MIVIGIGGSDLGARTIWQAIGGTKTSLTFVSSPDPETVSGILKDTDWTQTAINVISKSGTTLETMAAFMVLRASLIRSVGAKAHASHVFVITEPSESSILYQIARDEGYEVIPHPTNVGGRFSVLSSVGLFPAAVSGIDIGRMLSGARTVESERRRRTVDSIAATFAADQYLALTRHGKNIHVLMPYADLLSHFGYWYRQLWAESLGKIRDGVFVGPTPVAAFGPTDQHSQIQLYTQGPNDKTVTFVEVARFRRSVSVPSVWKERKGIGHIGGQSLDVILHAERLGTEHALTQAGRPNGTFQISSISPETLGALFITFEAAVAYMAELLGVNAFDQPGVEEGKHETKRILESMRRKI
jgi:glucose-6-phosphate isomerase